MWFFYCSVSGEGPNSTKFSSKIFVCSQQHSTFKVHSDTGENGMREVDCTALAGLRRDDASIFLGFCLDTLRAGAVGLQRGQSWGFFTAESQLPLVLSVELLAPHVKPLATCLFHESPITFLKLKKNYYFYYDLTCSMWKFTGQGLNTNWTLTTMYTAAAANAGSFNPLPGPWIEPVPLKQPKFLRSDS